MAGRPSGPMVWLFKLGVVGTLSDAQLLDRFVGRRDGVAEAALEELVTRHGPMVFRICRSVLHDAHDAEDAFQAVFLVLADRASSMFSEPARGIIRVFRLNDKKEIRTIESPCPWIEALAFTPDGRQVVAGLSDTSIVIWDVRAMND